MTRNRLVLSITGRAALHLSLRSQPMVGNFYAEATATVSLCRDKDQYGMVFRAAGEDYYRFAVNCNGQVRLERGTPRSVLSPAGLAAQRRRAQRRAGPGQDGYLGNGQRDALFPERSLPVHRPRSRPAQRDAWLFRLRQRDRRPSPSLSRT